MMMAWKVSGLSHRPGDHRLAAGLDALGDGDFAFARKQLNLPHLAQIHAHRIIGAVRRQLRRLNLDDGGFRAPSSPSTLAVTFSVSSSLSTTVMPMSASIE